MFRVWINIVDSDGTQLEVTLYRGQDRRHAIRVYRDIASRSLSRVVDWVGWEAVD